MEDEATAVDEGVQEALPKDPRWHRRQARKLLIGTSGLTNAQKIARLKQAVEHLNTAVQMMQTGEVK